MASHDRASTFELVWVIVSVGLGNRVMRKARQFGVRGGTVCLGRGTVSDRISNLLGISDVRREIVMLGSDGETADCVLDALNKEFHFEKRSHGIAFTTPICSIEGTRQYRCGDNAYERSEGETVYQLITAIVDKGKAELVIDAATRAGSRGGTVINARGAGIHETRKVFSMDIEPEKEIVLILSDAAKTRAILEAVSVELRMDVPGNGIIFTQNVGQAHGLYE